MTIIYKPYLHQWFASFTVNVQVSDQKFGSDSDLKYQSMLSIDLGTETALTAYNGQEFLEIENQRFTLRSQKKIKSVSKKLRRKRCPNYKKKIKASKRWKKARKKVSLLQRKVANLGTRLESKTCSCGGNLRELPCSIVDLISSTSKTRKHTGSMKQLGEMKRQKSQQNQKSLGHLETPTSQKLG